MIEEGKKLMDENEFEKAHGVWKSILSKDEFNLEALFFQAITLRKLGNYTESLKHFDTIINLSPSNASFYSERGVTLFHAKEFKASLKDMNRAVEIEPNNSYRYSSRAFIRNANEDLNGAIEDYRKAIELDPEDVIALNNLGLLEENAGRMEAAKKLFNKADKEAKQQGIYDIEASLERLKKEAEAEEAQKSKNDDKTQEAEIIDQDKKATYGSTILEVFRSKKEFKNYLNFVKSLFTKNNNDAK